MRELTRNLVNSMMGSVSLPAILSKVLSDKTLAGSFGQIKDLILGMLETYTYEMTLLQVSCCVCLHVNLCVAIFAIVLCAVTYACCARVFTLFPACFRCG